MKKITADHLKSIIQEEVFKQLNSARKVKPLDFKFYYEDGTYYNSETSEPLTSKQIKQLKDNTKALWGK